MKKLLAILSLVLIYAPAFAVSSKAFDHANPNASFFNSTPEPGTLAVSSKAFEHANPNARFFNPIPEPGTLAVSSKAFKHANPNTSFFNPAPEPGTLALFALACVSVLMLTLIKK